MVDPTAGAELADVDEALDARRDLHERAERLQARDGALDACTLGEPRGGVDPRIVGECLEAEADAIAAIGPAATLSRLDLQDGHIELLAHAQHVLGLVDPR